MLTSIQHDALKELLNISIGQAANIFSQLVGFQIKLAIPQMSLIAINREDKEYPHLFSTYSKGQLLTSSIEFGELLQGKAILLFPFHQTHLLVNLFLGEDEKTIDLKKDLPLNEIEYDALKEIGNLLLNAIMGGLGELLKTRFTYQPPQVESMHFGEFWESFYGEGSIYILILYSFFSIQDQNIEGTIVIQISMETIDFFLEKIDTYMRDLDG